MIIIRWLKLLFWKLTIYSMVTSIPTAQADCAESPDGMQTFGVVSLERQHTCTNAYQALPSEIKNSTIDITDRTAMAAHKVALAAYDNACLERIGSLRKQTQNALRQVLGFLFVRQQDSEELICTGFRLNKQLVATAAHCLWWGGARLDPNGLVFRTLAAPEIPFKPTGARYLPEVEYESQISDLEDYAILKIDTTTLELNIDNRFFRNELSYNEFVLIPGVNIWDIWFQDPKKYAPWTEAIRVNKGRSCFRYPIYDLGANVAEHCIFTMCQTLEAMSGAPIFGYDTVRHTLFIGGIHLRSGLLPESAIIRATRECGYRPEYNVGTTLPKRILDLANEIKE